MAKGRSGSLFMYRTAARRLNMVEAEAVKNKIPMARMLDEIIDTFFGIEQSEQITDEGDTPWYLRNE